MLIIIVKKTLPMFLMKFPQAMFTRIKKNRINNQ